MSKTFYVNPIAIAQEYGITVLADTSRLRNGEIGMIEKKDDDSVFIYYDPTVYEPRMRFTIAHELGHYVKGHLQDKPLYRDTNPFKNNFDYKEYEANSYASRLLMPKEKVDFLVYDKGITDVIELARLLNVSQQAMLIRLQNLGLVSK